MDKEFVRLPPKTPTNVLDPANVRPGGNIGIATPHISPMVCSSGSGCYIPPPSRTPMDPPRPPALPPRTPPDVVCLGTGCPTLPRPTPRQNPTFDRRERDNRFYNPNNPGKGGTLKPNKPFDPFMEPKKPIHSKPTGGFEPRCAGFYCYFEKNKPPVYTGPVGTGPTGSYPKPTAIRDPQRPRQNPVDLIGFDPFRQQKGKASKKQRRDSFW